MDPLGTRSSSSSHFVLPVSSERKDIAGVLLVQATFRKMVAAATGSEILLWALQAEGGGSEIGMAPGFFQKPLSCRILFQSVVC